MDQFKALLSSLSRTQQIAIAAVALAVGGAIFAFSHWRKENDFRPLYSSLAAEDASAVVQKLRERGVDYRVAENGGAVLVPSAQVAEMRLEMAGAGLPKTGRIGFELFDKTKFGATDFTEQINYRRALEGELERSVMSLTEVEQARVHVTFPKDSVFTENRLPAKASVMLKLRTGAKLSQENVLAIGYLVSSAVEGLAPEAVSVLDMRGNLLGRPKEKGAIDGPEPSEAVIEYRRKIEKDLLAKINSTLEPLLGEDKFRASLSAECDFTSGEQSEETFDPTRSVMTSSQRTKDTSTASSEAGVPGTSSNLPRAVPRPGSNTGISRESETVSYQSSRMVKRIRLPQGNIKRLSASVLLDQEVRWEGSGTNMRRVLTPPSPETLQRVSDVVAAAVGIQQERGDRLVVESLPFSATLNQEPPPQSPAPAPAPAPWKQINPAIWIGVAALALLAAGGMALRKRRKKEPEAAAPEVPLSVEAAPAQATPAALPAASVEGVAYELEKQKLKKELEKAEQLKLIGANVEKLTAEVRSLAAKESELCAGVLRGWLTEQQS